MARKSKKSVKDESEKEKKQEELDESEEEEVLPEELDEELIEDELEDENKVSDFSVSDTMLSVSPSVIKSPVEESWGMRNLEESVEPGFFRESAEIREDDKYNPDFEGDFDDENSPDDFYGGENKPGDLYNVSDDRMYNELIESGSLYEGVQRNEQRVELKEAHRGEKFEVRGMGASREKRDKRLKEKKDRHTLYK